MDVNASPKKYWQEIANMTAISKFCPIIRLFTKKLTLWKKNTNNVRMMMKLNGRYYWEDLQNVTTKSHIKKSHEP